MEKIIEKDKNGLNITENCNIRFKGIGEYKVIWYQKKLEYRAIPKESLKFSTFKLTKFNCNHHIEVL